MEKEKADFVKEIEHLKETNEILKTELEERLHEMCRLRVSQILFSFKTLLILVIYSLCATSNCTGCFCNEGQLTVCHDVSSFLDTCLCVVGNVVLLVLISVLFIYHPKALTILYLRIVYLYYPTICFFQLLYFLACFNKFIMRQCHFYFRALSVLCKLYTGCEVFSN